MSSSSALLLSPFESTETWRVVTHALRQTDAVLSARCNLPLLATFGSTNITRGQHTRNDHIASG